jgi:tetratricopeptide (TPR) repeat protein
MNKKLKSLLVAFTAGALAIGEVVAQDAATGLKLLDNNQACLAKDNFEKLAAATPSAENQFYLGYYYLRTNQPDLAKGAFEKGLAADPKNQLNAVGLGAVSLAKGDRAAAKMAFEAATKATKNRNMDVLFRAGEAYTGYVAIDSLKPIYKTTDPAQAVAYLDMAIALGLKNNQKNPDVYMAKGDALYLKTESGPAVSAYEDAYNVNPSLGKAFSKVAKIYYFGKNYKVAQETFQKAIEVEPNYAPGYAEYAEMLFYVRQYRNAAKFMNQYIEKVGQCASDDDILRNAQFQFVGENFTGAQTIVDQILQKGSKNPLLYRMAGWSAYKRNECEKAADNIQKFLQMAPQKAVINDYRYLGECMLKMSGADTVKAIANLEKAAEMDTVENGYKTIGSFYQSARKYKDAAVYYEKAIKREKAPSLQDLQNLATAYYSYGNQIRVVSGPDSATLRALKRSTFLKSDSIYAKMIERKPDYVYPYGQRAKATYFAFTPAEAIENGICIPHMEKYVPMAETDKAANKQNLVTIYRVLGSYNYIKLKDTEKAKEWYKKVLELEPTDKYSIDALQAFEQPVAPTPAPAAAPAPKAAPVKKAPATAPKKR